MKTKIIIQLAVLFIFLTVKANGDHEPKTKNTPKAVKAVAIAELTKNLEYDFDGPAVRNSYYEKLDQLAKAVIDGDYAVSLKGHADGIGAYKYNWVLSDTRAINVKKYLITKGVKENRIITTPFGSTLPIASNKTATGRQKNRRVEIDLKKIAG